MKIKNASRRARIWLGLLLPAIAGPSFAQGTAFTYQGRIMVLEQPASGSYDVRFALFNAVSGGAQQGGALTNVATATSNGLFIATLDFGNQFPGADRWLELAVRTNGGSTFSVLTQRQQITPQPYAITAAAVSGSVPAAQLVGTLPLAQLPANLLTNGAANANLAGRFAGDGGGLTNLNTTNLTSYDALGRLTSYLPNPFTTNYYVLTNTYLVSNDPFGGFNGAYVWWPQGATNSTYVVFTNRTTNFLVSLKLFNPAAYGPNAIFTHDANVLNVGAYVFSNDGSPPGNENPVTGTYEEVQFTGTNVALTVMAVSAVTNFSVSTNQAPTTLTNVFIANLGASVNAGIIGAAGLLSNSISGPIYPKVFITNSAVTIHWVGDSISAHVGSDTNYIDIVDSFASEAVLAAGRPAPNFNIDAQPGFPAYYFSTNPNVAYNFTVVALQAGINDLRFGLTNYGPTPDVSLINSQSNIIRRAAGAAAKLFILYTVPDWVSYDDYVLASGYSLWPPYAFYTNNNGFTFTQFQKYVQNVRKWQLAQIANTNLPVIVIDLKSLPLEQFLFDGLHPGTRAHLILGRLSVWALQNGWCPQIPVQIGAYTNYTLPGGVTLYITNGVIGKVQ